MTQQLLNDEKQNIFQHYRNQAAAVLGSVYNLTLTGVRRRGHLNVCVCSAGERRSQSGCFPVTMVTAGWIRGGGVNKKKKTFSEFWEGGGWYSDTVYIPQCTAVVLIIAIMEGDFFYCNSVFGTNCRGYASRSGLKF